MYLYSVSAYFAVLKLFGSAEDINLKSRSSLFLALKWDFTKCHLAKIKHKLIYQITTFLFQITEENAILL